MVVALALLFLTSPQSPDSTLLASFSGVRSAAARFRQDLSKASPQLVLARAQQVRAACINTRTAADSLAPRLTSNSTAQAELTALQRALSTCQREWETHGPKVNADSLRAWGPYRLSELDRALGRYQRARSALTTPASP
jgi:hypothetical protein